MQHLKGKAVVAQGGGPTAVINQSLVGLVQEARKWPFITHVYGARYGVRGILNEDFLNLTLATPHNLAMVAATPSSALGSTRDKPDAEYCARMVAVFQKHDVRYFFYIGGNDSAETCRIVASYAREMAYDLRVIHIPKTIDNDLRVTDHCPGFGSAARFVARPSPAWTWTTSPSGGVHRRGHGPQCRLADCVVGDGPARPQGRPAPHLRARAGVRHGPVPGRRGAGLLPDGRCVVALSEGIVDADGRPCSCPCRARRNWTPSATCSSPARGTLGDALSDQIKQSSRSSGCAATPSATCSARSWGWSPIWT